MGHVQPRVVFSKRTGLVNKAECDNGIPLKITNQTDPSIKKNGTWTVARVVSYWINNTYIISLNVSNFSSLCV
jgi:hypothetical protein